MKKVKVIQPFRDAVEEVERAEGEVFICDGDRAKELKELELVRILFGEASPEVAASDLLNIPDELNSSNEFTDPDEFTDSDEISDEDVKKAKKGKK